MSVSEPLAEPSIDNTNGGQASALVSAIQMLSMARSLEDITTVVRRFARLVAGADGATFVIKERAHCYYADEDAIAPLWKGQRFPLGRCISGWAMTHRQQVYVPDIYSDERIPVDAYRSTFVKSLVMTPIRKEDPIAAIGTYWVEQHITSQAELNFLQNLADMTAIAIANVTLYNELEHRVKERTEQLETTNQELQAYASSVSHDLRSPLRSIHQLTEMALNSEFEQPQMVSVLQAIGKESGRMADMAESLLALCKLSVAELRDMTVDFSELAADVVKSLDLRHSGPPMNIKIQPGIVVQGDAVLLRIVLENLLDNAWKYSKKQASPEIELGTKGDDDKFVKIFVSDNGIGFDMGSAARRLFRPFQRLHSDTEFPGTGVGLATVRRIIHRHEGQVSAESQPGCGTTIYFTLPKGGAERVTKLVDLLSESSPGVELKPAAETL